MDNAKEPHSVGVHDGTFHADEVTACALLMLAGLVDRSKIVRTRVPEVLARCDFVCDVGGIYDPSQRLFDHHQVTYQGEYSSAGMVLLYLRENNFLPAGECDVLRASLVMGVDAHDNGRAPQEPGTCSFSHIIANYNPPDYEATDQELYDSFLAALDFAYGHLERLRKRYYYSIECQKVVKGVMERSTLCLLFDRAVPWLDSFFALGGAQHPALFVIMPAKDQWKLRGIPPDYAHRMQVRLPLPASWAGLLDDELQKATGIPGAIFCHKGRFTSVWQTKEDALRALRYIFKVHGIKHEEHF